MTTSLIHTQNVIDLFMNTQMRCTDEMQNDSSNCKMNSNPGALYEAATRCTAIFFHITINQ